MALLPDVQLSLHPSARRVAKTVEQAHADDLLAAGLSVMELRARVIDAQDFHARFMETTHANVQGLHVAHAPQWADKFIRRNPNIPHAVLAKLGSNAIAKRRPDETQSFLDYICQCYEAQAPLLFRVVFGPVKNVQRYGAYQIADMAEYLTLIQLARMAEAIAAIYPHGVRVQVVPDDKRGSIANGWPTTYSEEYIANLQRMVNALRFNTWLTVEEGQSRLYNHYRVAEYTHAATMEIMGDVDFIAKMERAAIHARENLFSHAADNLPDHVVQDSAMRYLVAHKAEMLSGMWSPIDALPLVYANHPDNFQLYTMGRGLTKLPWQVRLPFAALTITQENSLVPLPALQFAS